MLVAQVNNAEPVPVWIFQHDEVRILRVAVQSTQRAPSDTSRAASASCSLMSATCWSKGSRGCVRGHEKVPVCGRI
jgi:hypothetical protein